MQSEWYRLFTRLNLTYTNAGCKSARLLLFKGWKLQFASLNGIWTAWMKSASSGRIDRRWRIALQDNSLPSLLEFRIRDWNRGHQRFRVRVQRMLNDLGSRMPAGAVVRSRLTVAVPPQSTPPGARARLTVQKLEILDEDGNSVLKVE